MSTEPIKLYSTASKLFAIVAYAGLVREEGEPMETNNRPGFERAQERLREAASIDLHVV